MVMTAILRELIPSHAKAGAELRQAIGERLGDFRDKITQIVEGAADSSTPA